MNTKQKNPAIWLFLLLGIGAFSFVVVALFYRYHFDGRLANDPATWGQFGDFLGGTLNPVFAYLSFTALIITLVIQTRQLEISATQLDLSREELAATRLELERSANAQAATADALKRQAEMSVLSAKIAALSTAIESIDSHTKRFGTMDPTNSRFEELRNLRQRRRELDSELNAVVNAIRAGAA